MGRKSKVQLAAEAAAAAGAAAAAATMDAGASAGVEDPLERELTSEQAAAEEMMAAASESRMRQPIAKLYRVDPATKKELLFDEVAPGVVNDSWLLKTYGGGTFVAMCYGPTDKYAKHGKKWGYLRRDVYELDPAIPFRPPPVLGNSGKVGRVFNPDGTEPNGGANAAAFEEMRQMALLGLFKQMQDQSALTVKMASDHSTAVMAMIQQMVSAPKGPGIVEMITALSPLLSGRKDPMELATQMLTLMKGGGAAPQSAMEQMKQLLELKGLLREEGGGDGEGGSWETMGPKLLGGALELLTAESRKPAQPPARVAARVGVPTAEAVRTIPANGGSGANATDTTTMPVVSENPPVADAWTAFEPHAVRLAQFAANGKEPFKVVQMVVVMANPQALGMIRELVSRPDAAVAIMERFPVLAPYEAWTRELVDEFYHEFHPGDAPDNGEGGGDGTE